MRATSDLPEPWLRGRLEEIPALQRAVLHALELAKEDLRHFCGNLSGNQIHARPHGLASVAFHLRHIAGSCHRLLTYAEGRMLTEQQLAELNSEMEASGTCASILAEFEAGLERASERIRRIDPSSFEAPRAVGKKALPTTVAGVRVHIADPTQRPVGQAITTAKIIRSSS